MLVVVCLDSKPSDKSVSRDATVIVHANSGGPIAMSFVYQTAQAAWQPSYGPLIVDLMSIAWARACSGGVGSCHQLRL